MGTRLNRDGYTKLIEENIEWLDQQPRTLEREHIRAILTHSIELLYPQESAVNFIRGLLASGDADIFDVVRRTRDKYALTLMDVKVLLDCARERGPHHEKCEALADALEVLDDDD